MSGPDVQLPSDLSVAEVAAALDRESLPFLTLAADGTILLRLGRRFVAWRAKSEWDERLLPRPALWARIETISGRSTVSGSFVLPAPDALLLVPLALFVIWILGVFGASGLTGVAVVLVGWLVPARIIAAGRLDSDGLELEDWLRDALSR